MKVLEGFLAGLKKPFKFRQISGVFLPLIISKTILSESTSYLTKVVLDGQTTNKEEISLPTQKIDL